MLEFSTKLFLGIFIIFTIPFVLQSGFANSLPEGHVPILDDKIVIIQHAGNSHIPDSQKWFNSDAIIYGDIVNISNETLYYIIVRSNVYSNEKLISELNFIQPHIFRYDYSYFDGDEIRSPIRNDPYYGYEDREKIANANSAVSPFKSTLGSGESTQFALIIGQTGWDCYDIWVESYESENTFRGISEDRLHKKLEITSISENNGVLTGKIFNPNQNTFDKTFVTVSKYDKDGILFGILQDETSSLSPNKSKNFEISMYSDAYPIDSHGDNFIFGKPHSYEVSAWGYSPWGVNGGQGGNEDVKNKEKYFHSNPIEFMASSDFYPDKKTISNIDIDEVKKTNSQRISNSCLNDPDQIFEKNNHRKQIPEWVKNNAGWWAGGIIEEHEFLSSIEYLLKNEILRIDIPQEDFHMELNSDKIYFDKYAETLLVVSGWYDGTLQADIRCDLWRPNELYADEVIITRDYTDKTFNQKMLVTQNWDEGEYILECKHLSKKFPPLSFEIIWDNAPHIDEKAESKVPEWVKNNAGWWAGGTITDKDFLKGLEYLVQNKIIDAGRYN